MAAAFFSLSLVCISFFRSLSIQGKYNLKHALQSLGHVALRSKKIGLTNCSQEHLLPTYARNICQECFFIEIFHLPSFDHFMAFFHCSIKFSNAVDYIMVTQRNFIHSGFYNVYSVVVIWSIMEEVVRVTLVGLSIKAV